MGDEPPCPGAAGPTRGARKAGALLLLAVWGCVKVGPEFAPPEAPVAASWLAADDPQIVTTAPVAPEWWLRFDDPKLAELVRIAQQQNPTLQMAGVRVVQARGQLGAAIGDIYPQKQQVFGELTHERLSDHESSRGLSRDVQERTGVGRNLPSLGGEEFWVTQFGFGASWELDLWGKFRRAVEAADANLIAQVASYDDALVSLTAEVASAYVNIRTYQERLRIARANAESQAETLRLARVRFGRWRTSETDVEQ